MNELKLLCDYFQQCIRGWINNYNKRMETFLSKLYIFCTSLLIEISINIKFIISSCHYKTLMCTTKFDLDFGEFSNI